MKFLSRKIVFFLVIGVAIVIFAYYTKVSDFFTLSKLQENHHILKQFVQNHYMLSVFLYIMSYSIFLACALPFVMPFALIGGFLYGIVLGLLYAGISCLLGSLISFVVLRYVIAHWVRDWRNERIDRFNQQIQKYGYSYLLMLHFLTVIPMFVINMLAAMANVPLFTVMWVTLVGTFPLNLLCVIAGQQLSSINSVKEIFSPQIMILLAVLAGIAIAPIIIRKIKGSVGV